MRVAALLLVLFLLVPVIAAAQTTEADVYVAQAVLDVHDKRYPAALDNLRRALELEPDLAGPDAQLLTAGAAGLLLHDVSVGVDANGMEAPLPRRVAEALGPRQQAPPIIGTPG